MNLALPYSDKVIPAVLCCLVVGLFWFSPPDLVWRIADVGESQVIRETILALVLASLSVYILAIRQARRKLFGIFQQPSFRNAVIFGLAILIWQWVSLLVNGHTVAGTSYCILWLSYLSLFIFTKLAFDGKIQYQKNVLVIISLSTLAASIYLLLKSIENNLYCPNILLNTVRLSAGEYLVPGWAIITGLFLYAESTRQKALWGGGLFFATLAIFQTSHRSPILGIVFSLACLLFLGYRQHQLKQRWKAWTIFFLIIISTITIQMLSYTALKGMDTNVTIQKRLMKNEEGSIGYRLFLMRVCMNMFMNNPIAGVGTGAFGKNYFPNQVALSASPGYSQIAPTLSTLGAERAHNEFFQILAENGAIGLILCGCFIGVVLFSSRKLGTGHSGPVSNMILSALIGFLASSLTSGFSWRWASNGSLFFLILGLWTCHTNIKREAPSSSLPKLMITFGVFVSIFLVIGTLYQIKKTISQLDYAKGFVLSTHDSNIQAIECLNNSLSINPENWRAAFLRGKLFLSQNEKPKALESFTLAAQNRINGVDHLVILARLHESTDQPSDNQKIKSLYGQALSAYPHSPLLKLFYADYLVNRGDLKKAKILAEQAKIEDPELYSAAKKYFTGRADEGRQLLIQSNKIEIMNTFETLFLSK
mgnify:CR=1 FL=1